MVGRLVVDGGQAVRDLVPQLEAAAARLGVAADGDRVSTARAGVALVEALRRQPERGAEVLAGATVPTSMAALGTSIVQSAEVTKALQEANWDLLRAATELGGAAQPDADAIKARLADALHADELAVGLVGRLRDAVSAATQLLARAAKPADQPSGGSTQVTSPAGAPVTGGPGAGVLSIGSFDKAEAERHLERVRERLRAEAHLDLTWEIEELPDDDG